MISPHSAGGRPDRAPERIKHNYEAWVAGDIDSMIGVVRKPNEDRRAGNGGLLCMTS